MKEQSIKIVRGDDTVLTLKAFGDYTSDTVYFTIKETRALTDVRYVDLSSTDSEITMTYENNYTTFEVTIPKENLQGLTYTEMVWDLIKDDDVNAILSGDVQLVHRARSDYDGLVVDEESLQFVTVDASQFEVNDMLIFDGISLVNISLSGLSALLENTIGVLTTPLDVYNLEGV